ncbi:hypothetical protein Ddc_03353 [Ditylenchus destructor]|nr:hypothetical protein Ddc_03353 [Ditylenchus destructor]
MGQPPLSKEEERLAQIAVSKIGRAKAFPMRPPFLKAADDHNLSFSYSHFYVPLSFTRTAIFRSLYGHHSQKVIRWQIPGLYTLSTEHLTFVFVICLPCLLRLSPETNPNSALAPLPSPVSGFAFLRVWGRMDTGQERRKRNSHYCPHPHGGANPPPRQDAAVVIIIAYLCPIIDDRMLPPSPCPTKFVSAPFPPSMVAD